MHSISALARRAALTLAASAVLFGALAPAGTSVAAQSGRKLPEKARSEKPAETTPATKAPDQQQPSGPPAPPITEKELQEAVQLGVNVVNVEAVVYDKKSGQILQGLKAGNFAIFEDGVKQEITNFQPTQGPMTLVMLIEFSKRIDNYYVRKEEVLRPFYSLVTQFVKPDDNIAIVAFDTRPFVVNDFTGNNKKLGAGLNFLIRNYPAFSESNLYDSLAFVLQGGKADGIDIANGTLMKGVDYGGLKDVEGHTAIVCVTIGLDTLSRLNYDEVRNVIADSGVPIYTIGVGNLFYKTYDARLSPEENMTWQQAFNTLRTFSRMSGGQYFPVTFAGEIPTTMQSITNLLRSQYSLGYTPTNTRREGKLRKIDVKVDVDGDGKYEDEKKFVIQHRESYIEPNDSPKKK